MKTHKEIYRAEQLPVFQNRMFPSADEARNCVKGDLLLAQDPETGLISNHVFKPELMRYDGDYQNEQAVSAVFRQHLQDVSEVIQRHFKGHTLLEVGCGKGHFLEQLQELGFDITGMDPIYEGNNPSVLKQTFSAKLELRADGIILRHVLEHVPDPVGFLERLRDANGGKGKIYIEVPCLDWICRNRAWFDIFYEHVNYFRLTDFHRMFERVYEAGHSFGGQYIYVVADLATIRVPVYSEMARIEFPEDFLYSITQYKARINTSAPGHRVASAIWGGASKGVIFSLLMERAGTKVDVVIDINPAKQGKFLAATGIRVDSPEQAIPKLLAGADIFVMNSNYLNEVRQLTANQFNYLLVDHDGF